MWTRFLSTRAHRQPERVYLDYAAATPMTARAKAAMMPFLDEMYGNPGGIHAEGVAAKRALEGFREVLARRLQVQPSGVVLTSGGTESNNLAITGVVEALAAQGRAYSSMSVVTTAVEHPATLRTVETLARKGVSVVLVPVTAVGVVDLPALKAALSPETVLVTLAYVNSEVGAITDCHAVRRILDEAERHLGTTIRLHVDAAQAPLWLPCDMPRLGADLLSLDGGKCGGGKGVGALVIKKGVAIEPLLRGGGQERGLRPGTEPLPLVAAFATAFEEAQVGVVARRERVTAVRDYARTALASRLPQAMWNGPDGDLRVANNIHISIPGLDAEFAVISLDAKGVACSTKSACSTKGGGASTVVLAMTGDDARARSTIRFTLGPETTTADIDRALGVLTAHVAATLSVV